MLCFLVVLCLAFVFLLLYFGVFALLGFWIIPVLDFSCLSKLVFLFSIPFGSAQFSHQWWDRKLMTLSPWSTDLVQVKQTKKKHSYWFPWVRKQGLIPFYHHARNNATLISYKAPLPSERWIHCCFAFRNLYLCQGGLLNRTFYHQRRSPAAAKCLPAQHSRSNQFEQSGQLIFCIDLLTRDSSQITFLWPVSPKGALGSAAWSRPNSHSDHALYCDYSASSLLSDEIRVCHHKCYLATRSLSACTVKKKTECNKKIATCVQQ